MQISKNEAIALMHENTSESLRKIARHIEEFEMEREVIVRLLLEISDEQDAQSVVVRLRELITKPENFK